MLKRITTSIIFVLFTLVAFGQGSTIWTLQDCLDYAGEHNYEVRKQLLSIDNASMALQERKWSFVPSVSLSNSATVSTGRVLDPTTYQFVETKFTGNNSTSLSSSIYLFEGGKKIINLKKAKESLRGALIQEELIKDNIQLNVIAAYLDILSAKDQIHIAQNTLAVYKEKLNKIEKLYAAGSITESDVLQMKAQICAAENNVRSYEYSYELAILSICNLLDISDNKSFMVADLQDGEIQSRIIDIENAIDNHPSYQTAILNHNMAEMDIKIARASMMPRLSLSAGYGSSYSSARKLNVINPDGTYSTQEYPFLQQYQNNASAYVTLGLSIPILSGLSARNSVKRTQLSEKEAEMAISETRKQLKKQITQALINCKSAEDKYRKAAEEVYYAEEALRQIDKKYNLGMTDYLTWSASVSDLENARYSLSDAKFLYYLRSEILMIYAR